MSAFTWDNFKLGAAGLADAYSRIDDAALKFVGLEDSAWAMKLASLNNTSHSVDAYVSQVKAGAEDYSRRVDASDGISAAEEALLRAGAKVGVEQLGTAADATGRNIFDFVRDELDRYRKFLPYAAGAAAVVGAAVIAWRVSR